MTNAPATRLQILIEAASRRILKASEQSEMVLLFWEKTGGTKSTLRGQVNKAYAMAKKYDQFGGSQLHNELTDLLAHLGSDSFKVLYAACR